MKKRLKYIVSFFACIGALLTGCVYNSQYTYDIVIEKTLLDSAKQLIVRYSTDTFKDSIVVAPIISGYVISPRRGSTPRYRPDRYTTWGPSVAPPPPYNDNTFFLVTEFSIPYADNQSSELYLGERLRSIQVQADGKTLYKANYVQEKTRRTEWNVQQTNPKKSSTRYWDAALYLGFDDVQTQILVVNETNATFRIEYTAIHPQQGRFDSTITLEPVKRSALLEFRKKVNNFDKNFITNMNDYIVAFRVYNASSGEKIFERTRESQPFIAGEWQYYFYPPPNQQSQYVFVIRRSEK